MNQTVAGIEPLDLELALDLVVEFEGYHGEPYRCPGGVWTIGYGATRGWIGRPVTEGTGPISEADAMALAKRDLDRRRRAVLRLIRVPLTVGQRAALLDFCYNLGSGSLRASTLRARLNRGDYEGAASEFPRWVYAGGRRLAGLVRRREAERRIFTLAA